MSTLTVHLWEERCAALHPRQLAGWRELLRDDEVQHVKMLSTAAACEFVAGRGLLREVLASELEVSPRSLVFKRGRHGKPSLATPAGTGISFNISHSDGLLLLALCYGPALGVDTERLRNDPAWWDEQHLALIFTPDERRRFLALPPSLHARAFAAQWTRKEAVLKCLGLGVGADLQAFQVRPSHDLVVAEALAPGGLGISAVHVQTVILDNPFYGAAIAVQGHRFRVQKRALLQSLESRPRLLDDRGRLVYCGPRAADLDPIFMKRRIHEAEG